MGCVLVLVLVGLPRLALIWIWLTHHGYVREAFGGQAFWPVLGFVFLPTTTVAFAYAAHAFASGTGLAPAGWILVVLGFLLDAGLHGGGWRARSWSRRRD
jgi:hypothetical protein